jgi:hypothetical protein
MIPRERSAGRLDARGSNAAPVCRVRVKHSTISCVRGATRARGATHGGGLQHMSRYGRLGVWHSPDAGASWTPHRTPFPLNSRVQALVAYPGQARTVFAGGDTGLFGSRDSGARWEHAGAQGICR